MRVILGFTLVDEAHPLNNRHENRLMVCQKMALDRTPSRAA